MSSACHVCDAAEHASDDSLRSLVRYQAVMLDRARAALLPTQVEVGRLRDRVRELEETIERQHKAILRANDRKKAG